MPDAISNYYYVQGRRVNVQPRTDLLAVNFRARAGKREIEAFEASRESGLRPCSDFPQLQGGSLRLYRIQDLQGRDIDHVRSEIKSREQVESVGSVYINENGGPLVLIDEIVCKFNADITPSEVACLKSAFGLTEVLALGFSENAFVFRTSSPNSALSIAKQLVEQGYASYAYPNWIEPVGFRHTGADIQAIAGVRVTDPLFEKQWHLHNTGQLAGGQTGTIGADISATSAWQITMGSPAVRLAVIDGGIDIAHDDFRLPDKVLHAIDMMATPPDENPVGTAHGTQVAGMAVAAANNGIAGVGVAPNCALIPIKAGDTMSQLLMARAFAYAADKGADVITCSLGPIGQWLMTDALREAIDYATTYGRNGRGCVYTQAVDNQPNPVALDQVSSYERSISVSRTNNLDLYDGAATGPELDLCAPGRSVLTITNTSLGDSAPTATVTGTSFAAPIVAGVACLVLSVDPSLSWQEVKQILLDSADKVGASANPYLPAAAGRPPGTRNDLYGYGRVNAHRAVRLAQLGSTRDLYFRSIQDDSGSMFSAPWGFWYSPDIWVRRVDDDSELHEAVAPGQDNFIYVRARNRGTVASLAGWLRCFVTTHAATELRYPYDYRPSIDDEAIGQHTAGNLRPRTQFPSEGTYLISEERIDPIPPGGERIVKVRWRQALVPATEAGHACLSAEISPHDGPESAGSDHWQMHNFAHKNVAFLRHEADGWTEVPCRFGHPENVDPFIELEMRNNGTMRELSLILDLKDAALVASVLSTNEAEHPSEAETEGVASTPNEPVLAEWRVTLLQETRAQVVCTFASGVQQSAVVTLPAGTNVLADLTKDSRTGVRPEGLTDRYTRSSDSANTVPAGSPLSPITIDGAPMVQVKLGSSPARVRVPLSGRRSVEGSIRAKMVGGFQDGSPAWIDIAQISSEGRLTGGLRLVLAG